MINVQTKSYKSSSFESNLREYKNDFDTFIQAIIQTLEVEVRSKFQTERMFIIFFCNKIIEYHVYMIICK